MEKYQNSEIVRKNVRTICYGETTNEIGLSIDYVSEDGKKHNQLINQSH